MSDLEKFRENWKKELKNHQLRPDHAESSSPNENKDEKSVTLASTSHHATTTFERPVSDGDDFPPPQLMDEPSGSLQEDHDRALAVHLQAKEPDTHEYYPFKILTHFLNEAPKKVNKTKSGKSSAKYDKTLTYAKRKYFSVEGDGSSSSSNLEKKQKTDEQMGTAEMQPKSKSEGAEDRFLDLFIADLDEINEIPFFDTTVPRELAMKIFQHFDMQTLCNCSQVSRSWKSLSDDELLWCRICHKLGYDVDLTVCQATNWKSRVRRQIEQKRLLIANWKARVGKPYHLQYAKGGVLCAVTSHWPHIVAGYTSCEVRSWDMETGDTCTFNASNTALVIDESTEELGCLQNEIKQLCVTPSHTAASFRHGFVDIWHTEGGVDPVHTLTFRNPDVSALCGQEVDSFQCLLAASQGSRVQVVSCAGTEVQSVADFHAKAHVQHMEWYGKPQQDWNPGLVLCCPNAVHLAQVGRSEGWTGQLGDEDLHLKEIHHIIWSPISCTKCRSSQDELAVGFTSSGNAALDYKVNLYDLSSGHHKSTLTGHTWLVSCMHLPQDLPYQMVTGSGDRKIRLFDTRAGQRPLSTLSGHIAKVTSVQMDNWKVVSGDEAGFVCVWDQRMRFKLWDIHNRHPVQYCHFQDRLLTIGNVPYQKFPEDDQFDNMSSLRYRGTVQVYDFFASQQTEGVPDICLSSYNEPEAYDYNIGLAVPYDDV